MRMRKCPEKHWTMMPKKVHMQSTVGAQMIENNRIMYTHRVQIGKNTDDKERHSVEKAH